MKTTYVQNSTILIIDDNPTNLDVLCNYLTKRGARVLVKKSGERGIDCAIKKQPDIILLDILMPTMDGYEVCRRLKREAITKNIPIIFVSALVETIDKLKGFELGCVDYVTKPIQVEEVLARLETHLSIISLQQQLEINNKKQKELTHILCHDLRNAIGQIQTLSELKKIIPDSTIEYDLLAENSTKNALNIIEMVGKLCALEEGKRLVDLRSENLQELIEQAIALVNDKLKNKNINIALKINKNIQVNVESVSFINSVMINLLTNAIKFSHADTQIIIATEKTKTHILLTIEDFGIGMPKELCTHVFDMNKPTTRSGTQGEIGTGFGMPLVKKFVEAYQGTIEVISHEKNSLNENQGTKFIITLPNISIL